MVAKKATPLYLVYSGNTLTGLASHACLNVRAMNKYRFIVFDQLSRNQLGEFATLEAAEECFLRFVRADPSAAEHLEIWDDDEEIKLRVDPEKITAVTAA